METSIAQFLPCNHDPTAVIIVVETTDHHFRFRCTECGAESRKRVAPEWFWTTLTDDSQEAGDESES